MPTLADRAPWISLRYADFSQCDAEGYVLASASRARFSFSALHLTYPLQRSHCQDRKTRTLQIDSQWAHSTQWSSFQCR